jgi:hypothetical protein
MKQNMSKITMMIDFLPGFMGLKLGITVYLQAQADKIP